MTEKQLKQLILNEVRNLLTEQYAVELDYTSVMGAINDIKKNVAELEKMVNQANQQRGKKATTQSNMKNAFLPTTAQTQQG